MLCWSCKKKVPDSAEFCPHCEAAMQEEPSAEDKAAVEELLSNMGPELLDELREAFEKSATGEEFVNRIMIGDCPKCGSSATSDCEDDPDLKDPCVARCFDCGQLWCPDCGEFFKGKEAADHDCPAWEDIDFDDEDWDEDEDLE
jgi:hypothetical protein